jgi:hypothetical protein
MSSRNIKEIDSSGGMPFLINSFEKKAFPLQPALGIVWLKNRETSICKVEEI